jgi:FkbM family methyltransferase
MTGLIQRTPMGLYVLRDDTHLSRWVERGHRLDTDANVAEIASFAHRIPAGAVVVDAGACLGDHAISYSQIVGSAGCVYAFEPHPQTFEALVMNMARLRNVACLPIGLSDAPGRVRFMRDPNIGASCVSDVGDVTVEVTTLDTFLIPRVMRCDFMHLDAEGMETRILRGGRQVIERYHPLIVTEVCDAHLRRAGSSADELLGLLAEFGYTIHAIPGHDDPDLRDVLAVWS